MSHAPTVVGVAGSMRDESYTRTAVEYALEAAEAAGAETDLIHLADYDLPVYEPGAGSQGDGPELTRRVREADGVVLGTPVYHGSYSGALKNFHDYCSFDEYEDTVVGLLTVAGGGTYASTLDHLRITVRGVHGWVIPHQVGIRNVSDELVAGSDGRREFVDDGLRERVEKLGRQVADHAATTPGPMVEAAADD